MYRVLKDMVFLCLALALTGSAEEGKPVLDCDCLAKSYRTMEGEFTSDDAVCVSRADGSELISSRRERGDRSS